MKTDDLRQAYAAIRTEAVQLAGGLTDLVQRATVYHHLYRDSGGNHIFPLIAAHGALWARGYFRFGTRLGRLMAIQYGLAGSRRREQVEALAVFADAFRDINRRVCVDVYAHYHFVGRFGDRAGADRLLPAPLFEALRQVWQARRRGRALSNAERLAVFEAHFRHEQEHDVGPSIARAAADFSWPAMRWLALRPVVRFAYFPNWRVLRFRDFADVGERIRNGLQAFAWGERAGWPVVEERLARYRILPPAFFREGPRFFTRLKAALLMGDGCEVMLQS